MGKAQSKRSVDITTDPKKDGTVDEGTGEMKKIEDVDQLKPQVNGDTHHNENEDKEKVAENGETENEKDLSTEKENQKPQEGATATVATITPDPGAGGDNATTAISTTPTNNENTTATATTTTTTTTTANNEQSDANETLNDSKTAESTTSPTETPDSSKKPKKEKVKKKWSFRSISFGKKDKQKPSKKEDVAAANTSAVNGECEKVPEETTTEETKTTEENKEVEPSTTESTAAVPTEENKNSVEENKPANVDTEVKAENVETTNVATTEVKTDEVVTNGSTEKETENKTIESVKSTEEETASPPSPVPEQKEQQQSTIENVPTANHTPAVVVETEKPQEETITSASLTNGIEHHDDAKESKLNGSAESPKIEVKSEENKSSVVDVEQNSNIEQQQINEKEIILSSETEKSINVVQISTDISNNIVAKDDDNNDPINNPVNKLNSSLPPPLPCSPPPSQVMVFALSETKQEQQPILEEIVKSENLDIKNTSDNLVEKLEIATGNIISDAENLIKDKVEEIVEKIEKSSDICEVPVIVEESDKNIFKTTSDNQELKLETTNEKNEIQNSTQIGNASTEVITSNIAEEKLIATEQELSFEISEKSKIDNAAAAALLTENTNEINKQLNSVKQDNTINIEKQSEILIEKENKIEEIVEVNKLELNEKVNAAAIDEKSNLLTSNEELKNEIETKIPEINIDSKTQDENNDQLDNNTSPANEIVKQEDTMSTAIFDNNINEIVETIALIEEYTDTVASASQDLIESVTSIVNNDENVSITKINENQTSEPITETTTTTIPKENKFVENSIEKNEDEESSINEENLPTPPPTPTSQTTATTTTTSESEENIIREIKSENDKITEEETESTITSSDNINSSVTESKSDKSESDECSSEITTSTSQNVQQHDNDITATATNNAPTNQNKENGVEGNHDELAEVSATESLNGVDHKTIENIKSENQQIEKVGTEVIAQGAAAAVAE